MKTHSYFDLNHFAFLERYWWLWLSAVRGAAQGRMPGGHGHHIIYGDGSPP